MRINVISLLFFLLINAASAQHSLQGLYPPIDLHPDTTVVFLKDFLGSGKAGAVILPFGLSDRSLKKDTLLLTGQPREKLTSMAVNTSSGTRHLLLRSSALQPMVIRIKASKIPGKGRVKLIGEFNEGGIHEREMTLTDGWYESRLKLPPGRYTYRIRRGNKEMPDPGNSRQVIGETGLKSSLLIVESSDKTPPGDYRLSWNKEYIRIRPTSGPVHYITYFNNQQLDMMCNKRLPPSCRIQIPEEAKTMPRSYIRIFSYQNDQEGKHMLIPLAYGQPILEAQQLNSGDWHATIAFKPKKSKDLTPVLDSLNYFDSLSINAITLNFDDSDATQPLAYPGLEPLDPRSDSMVLSKLQSVKSKMDVELFKHARADRLVEEAALKAFSQPNGDLQKLVNILELSLAQFGSHHLMANPIRLNKLNRFHTANDIMDSTGLQRMSLWQAFIYAIPGTPTLEGSRVEASAAGRHFHQHLKSLGPLRSGELALGYGSTDIWVSRNNILQVSRSYFDQHIWVVINPSPQAKVVSIPENWQDLSLTPLVTNTSIKTPEGIELQPYSYQYFKINKSIHEGH